MFKVGRPGYRVLRFFLGPSEEHTVYEAEIVGELLGAELLRRERTVSRTSIAADNKPSLQASRLRRPAAGHYLMDELHSRVDAALRKHPNLDLTLRWVPGHVDIVGNEIADQEAKKAANGVSSDPSRLPRILRKPLPASRSAVKQAFEAKLKERAKEAWKSSTRYTRISAIDQSLPGPSFGKMISGIPRRSASLILQLRTGHAPINLHLHRIGAAETAGCAECGATRESVQHFLFVCPAHQRHRARLVHQIGRNAFSLKGLLGTADNLKHTLEFIHRTGRLKTTFGTVQLPTRS